MSDIGQGIVIGVSAGIVTSIILGICSWLIRWRDRREQVRYVRHLVVRHMRTMVSAARLPPPERGKDSVPADLVRFAHFRVFEAEIDAAVAHRTSTLSYKQVYSLQRVVRTMKNVMTDLPLQQTLPLPIANSMWEKFQQVEWLNLPQDLP